MIKLDFLGHGAIEADSFYDKTVTTGMQAFKKGMEFIVDQAGGQMLIYASICPNMATAPYVHMRRISCDSFNSTGLFKNNDALVSSVFQIFFKNNEVLGG